MRTFLPDESPEHKTYKVIEHWKPEEAVTLEKELADSKQSLFLSHIYAKVKAGYQRLPKRKDGKDAFVHPLNVVWDLKKAGVRDITLLSTALMHDYIEEKVDLFRHQNNLLKKNATDVKLMDDYEEEQFGLLKKELTLFCDQHQLPLTETDDVLKLLGMLTRHKRHFYYRSISTIFNCTDSELKEKAIQIKLADRIHNIQSIGCFNEEKRIFECFKNLFILNSTKMFLQKGQKKKRRSREASEPLSPIEMLFKKCSKATYDAFLQVLELCGQKGARSVRSMLQLAFKKFAFEKHGLWEVTDIDERMTHPMRLYMGIVRKYDARLHQEWELYDKYKATEMAYCHKFFSDLRFNEAQLLSIVEYKDAYALKEVVAKLLYDPKYVIGGFSCSSLCSRGMKCMKVGEKGKFNHVLLPP
ncbi:hypothetical protein HZC30_05165 [Candidatus Woesearchaeota archaeon]|nr:hypothetical protein [Candidatus Woesearchaeota archaeon]